MKFSEQYDELVKDIIENGVSNEGKPVRTYWKDGKPAYTKAVWGRQFLMKPEDGFPILYKKYVNEKSFSSELDWILQHASNDVSLARELGTNVWNEWEQEDGTIKKGYGYQIANNTYTVLVKNISEKALKAIGKTMDEDSGKNNYFSFLDEKDEEYVELKQMDYVIHQLIDNPYSRQTVTMLWNPSETHEMALPPCVFYTHWEVMGDNRLYLSVKARSSDVFLGLPFNVSQYAREHRKIAHITGYELGDFVFSMDDAHLYDRHIPVAQDYLEAEENETDAELYIDENVQSYQDFKRAENIYLKNYRRENMKSFPAPIAVGWDEYLKLKEENAK